MTPNLCQEYGSHPEFSETFTKLLDEITEEFGPQPENDSKPKEGEKKNDEEAGKSPGNTQTQGKKRKSSGNESTNKKMKIDSVKVKSIEDAGGSTGALVEAQMLNAKAQGVSLVIKPQNRCFIMNQGTQVVTLKHGLILCAYGKGKWNVEEHGAEMNPAKDVLFSLDSPDDLVSWCRAWFIYQDYPKLTNQFLKKI